MILGHRGGRGEGLPPENTLEAFARALADGADGVELDVRLTRDGHPVVFHDPTLERVTRGADRRAIHAVARHELPLLEGGARVPALEDALEVCRGHIVNVELKSDLPNRGRLARKTVRAVRRGPRADIVYSSFHPFLVLAVAALAPRTPRAILVGATTRRLATALPLAMRRMVTAAHLEQRLATSGRVARLRDVGLRVAAWTVNDAARASALVASGVAWLISDRPGTLVRALA